jgi:hypothetical protein
MFYWHLHISEQLLFAGERLPQCGWLGTICVLHRWHVLQAKLVAQSVVEVIISSSEQLCCVNEGCCHCIYSQCFLCQQYRCVAHQRVCAGDVTGVSSVVATCSS